MEINEVRDAVNKTANEKGFWSDMNSAVTQSGIKWTRAVEQAFISQKLMLTVSELGEALEALRDDHFANRKAYEESLAKEDRKLDDEWNKSMFKLYIKNTFEDELADAIIRILDIAGQMGIDMDWHLQRKMEYNGARPYKHGRNF
jgi:NTP pyrophosphatase (non-canonical NTP hydrolase)